MQKNLTKGSVLKTIISFSIPFLISNFLQTLYGLVDIYFVGQNNGSDIITAVSVGSQIMHMLTVIIVGLAMGGTVMISQSVGAKDDKRLSKNIGNTVSLFVIFAQCSINYFNENTGSLFCFKMVSGYPVSYGMGSATWFSGICTYMCSCIYNICKEKQR